MAALAAACGGGSDAMPEPPAPVDTVPASASQSVTGMWNYLKALTASTPENKEPADVAGFAPPQPDDAEPDSLQ
jgi:hypothetical protein